MRVDERTRFAATDGDASTAEGRRYTVLFLLHRVPYPPDKGEKIRAFNELSSLTRRGHVVHLVAFADDAEDVARAGKLNALCASVSVIRRNGGWSAVQAGSRLVLGGPLSLGYFASARMRRTVQHVLSRVNPDAVLGYSSAMAQYVPPEWWPRTVFDLVDADSEKWRVLRRTAAWPLRMIFAVEADRLARYEGEIVRRARCTLVSTAQERDVLRRDHGAVVDQKVRVVVNSVNAAPLVPAPEPAVAPPELARHPAVVFTGAMDYAPNVDAVLYFVREILPLVRRELPALFWVVGRNPHRSIRRLAASSGVRVTGYVPDVKPYLSAAGAVVVPIRIARGVQTKLLEAMSAGRPVVCTPEVNAAIQAVDGEHVLIADSPAAFAAATVRLIVDPARAARLGAEARAFVAERFGQEALDNALDDAIACAAGGRACGGEVRTPAGGRTP